MSEYKAEIYYIKQVDTRTTQRYTVNKKKKYTGFKYLSILKQKKLINI